MTRRDDRRIQEERQQAREHINVKEHDNLFPPYCRVLAAHVEEHDGCHSEGCYVDERGCWSVSIGFEL